jgi:hypothetical protein
MNEGRPSRSRLPHHRNVGHDGPPCPFTLGPDYPVPDKNCRVIHAVFPRALSASPSRTFAPYPRAYHTLALTFQFFGVWTGTVRVTEPAWDVRLLTTCCPAVEVANDVEDPVVPQGTPHLVQVRQNSAAVRPASGRSSLQKTRPVRPWRMPASTCHSSAPGVWTTACSPRRIHMHPTLGLVCTLHLVHECRRLVLGQPVQQGAQRPQLDRAAGALGPEHRLRPPTHQSGGAQPAPGRQLVQAALFR